MSCRETYTLARALWEWKTKRTGVQEHMRNIGKKDLGIRVKYSEAGMFQKNTKHTASPCGQFLQTVKPRKQLALYGPVGRH